MLQSVICFNARESTGATSAEPARSLPASSREAAKCALGGRDRGGSEGEGGGGRRGAGGQPKKKKQMPQLDAQTELEALLEATDMYTSICIFFFLLNFKQAQLDTVCE